MRKLEIIIAFFTCSLFIITYSSCWNINEKINVQSVNPATNELGKWLFFDNRLSFNNTKSCSSCHDPKFAFSDGYRRSITPLGENVLHNAPSLINIGQEYFFNWANPSITTLEKQHERPLFNEHPIEMGAKGNELAILEKLKADTFYQRLFKSSYPNDRDPYTFPHIIQSIASFVKTLHSLNAPYDRFVKGDEKAISASAKNGMKLFFSNRLKCVSCHPPPYFTMAAATNIIDSVYFNMGLYNVMNKNIYPPQDNGLAAFTGKVADDGKFKVPSLRNVSVTMPYMHDGSINTLGEVLDNYARGGRNVTYGQFAGDGKDNRFKDKRMNGFTISAEEKMNLIDFLFSLTDSSAITKPEFQNPYNVAQSIVRGY